VQLHGGMGMTEELNIGHYFKRLTIIDTLFGNADFHLKRFGAL
jgi:alkylation response protein AidB-like acyl-CoA dehydrogenase